MTRLSVILLLCITSVGCKTTTPLFGAKKTRIPPPPTGSIGQADSYYRSPRNHSPQSFQPLQNDRNELDAATIDNDTSLDGSLSRTNPSDPNRQNTSLANQNDLIWRRPGESAPLGDRTARQQGFVSEIPPRDYVDLSPRGGQQRRYREPLPGQVAERDLLGPMDDLVEITNLPASHPEVARQPRIRGLNYGDSRLQ